MSTQPRSASSDPRWPLIVGFGGVDAAGRWGGPNHPAFESMVHDRGDMPDAPHLEQLRLMELARREADGRYRFVPEDRTLDAADLVAQTRDRVRDNIFVREVPFDASRIPALHKMRASEVVVRRSDLPDPLPEGWVVEPGPDEDRVRIVLSDSNDLFGWKTRASAVSTAGSIPNGFQPYPEEAPGPAKRRVARNLWLGLWSVNDAFRSVGLDFAEVSRVIPQDDIGVYFASAMGQVGPRGFYGYVKSHIFGERPQSTQVPFSLTNTPGAFVAAYTTGSVGHISSDVGACATFMLNLHNALRDMRSGKRRFAIVGACDAAVYPWTIAGYDVMNALARDEALPRDENGRPIHRLASRPFGQDRLGFVIGEGSFAMLLADRELARELGLPARGLVCDVAAHSDGWKKSISGPGIGDYPCLHGILSTVSRHFGIDALRKRSFVSAHGSSTPQNGITEARLYREYAEAFGIEKWHVTAPKSFVGHSMGAAGGVQSLANVISLERGVIPRIRNLDTVGVDPELGSDRVDFLVDNHEFDPASMDIAIGVSKGFGGFNVAEAFAGPRLAREYLDATMDASDRKTYEAALDKRAETAAEHQDAYLEGRHMIHYDSNRPLTVDAVRITSPEQLEVDGYHPFDFGEE